MDIFEIQSAFCEVFASPVRLKIMWFIGEGERTVSEIAEHLEISIAGVSQHLRVMRDKGAVVSRKEGRTVYYRIANKKFLEGARLIREGLIEELKKRLDASI